MTTNQSTASPRAVFTHRFAVLALFGLFVSLCVLVFTAMTHALHGHWTTANDLDAGYLLFGVVVYMLWQFATPIEPDRDGSYDKLLRMGALLLLVGSITAAGVTAITANKAITLGLLVIAFAPFCVWVLGARWLSNSVHAAAVLFMATPAWFVLVPQLQGLTAAAVNWLLARGSWPIYVEGNLIALPQGALEIAAGCAGLKFLQTALALTLIEGFLARRGWRAMALIGAFAVMLAIVSNWLRVSIITLLALEFDPNHPWVADHNWVGWLLFAAIFGPLFYWLGRVEVFARPDAIAVEASAAPTGIATALSLRAIALRAALALALAFGSANWLFAAAEGTTSARIGAAQIAAVEALCAPGAGDALSNFPGANLVVDCLTPEGRQLGLRGFLREEQEQEVINPVNELVPGLGLLEYRVTSQPGAESTNAPAIVEIPGPGVTSRKIAYGFYATGAWTASARDFKVRSLLRPFVPGPVYALVVVDPHKAPGAPNISSASSASETNGAPGRSSAALRSEFMRFANALERAATP